jgi:tetratricopeptide (TPR) repeat protein
VLIALTLVFGASAEAITPVEKSGGSTSPTDAFDRSLREVAEQGRKPGEGRKAFATLKERIALPEFGQLSPARQYAWLHAMAVLALQFNDFEYGYARALETTGMPQADKDDWMVRFFCGTFTDHAKDALYALINIARQWPESLATYNDVYVARFVRDVLKTAEPFDQKRLLEALYAAKWTFKGGLEPSPFWAELVRMQVEKKEAERAKEVSERITAPRTLVGMRVDKRFDALVAAVPERFDVRAAIDREDALLQQLSTASPRVLALKSERVMALVDAGRFEDAVKVADEVLATSATAEAAAANYDDAGEQFVWILDYRAQALQGLARWGEAEKYLKDAASRLEEGQPNVSNAINLAYFYASLGRSREAAAALGKLATSGPGTSPYGQVQIQRVLLRAAITNKDVKGTRAALDLMRKNQAASPGTFQEALLDANQMDEAARVLISRLQDPTLRSEALLDVQDYQKVVPTPANLVLQKRWTALRARDDVQKAVTEAGRIEQLPLTPAMR